MLNFKGAVKRLGCWTHSLGGSVAIRVLDTQLRGQCSD